MKKYKYIFKCKVTTKDTRGQFEEDRDMNEIASALYCPFGTSPKFKFVSRKEIE